MSPVHFREANTQHKPPVDFAESQVKTVPSYVAMIQGGSCDGEFMTVVAWRPSPEEIKDIMGGKLIYLTAMGGLPPHFLSTDFHIATHPA